MAERFLEKIQAFLKATQVSSHIESLFLIIKNVLLTEK